MKIIAISDLHGRNYWKSLQEDFDKLVFIGDYFDSREGISFENQRKNFEEIIEYKKSNDNVILLVGNHDSHYVLDEQYSGFQFEHADEISNLLKDALPLMQLCYVSEKIIFSHAGVTKTWCADNNIDFSEESVNELFRNDLNVIKFKMGENFSSSGDDVCQSPVWVRPNSLIKDALDGFIQVVGHTQQDKITYAKDLILIDTLSSSKEYLIYENGQFTTNHFAF